MIGLCLSHLPDPQDKWQHGLVQVHGWKKNLIGIQQDLNHTMMMPMRQHKNRTKAIYPRFSAAILPSQPFGLV